MYKIVKLEDVVVDSSKELFVDFETIKLYGTIRLAQFFQRGWEEALLVEWPEPFSLAAMLDSQHIVAHNLHYEVTCVQQNTGTKWQPKKADDTFLLARLHHVRKEFFSLDHVMQYTYGFCPYTQAGLDKKKLQKSNWASKTLTKDQSLYAAIDVFYLPEVYEQVQQQRENISYKIDMLTLGYCCDFQWNGLSVDQDRMSQVYDDVSHKLAQITVPVNVNSPKQVKEWLDLETTADLALAKIELDPDQTRLVDGGYQLNEAAGLVRKARKLKKQLSFMSKFEDTVRDGKVYGKFKPSARSGRLTSDDQNLQQLPRSLKSCFGTDEDRVIIYSDYAQIELRHICALTNCITMEQLFREGQDLHAYTAEMLFGKDWTKEHRQISKTANFSLLYGGGIKMYIDILIKTANIWISEREANKVRHKWRNLWREIYAWQQVGISAWQKGRLGSTPLGRKYKAKMMTDQLNIENQGGAADVNKLAMHYMVPKLKDTDFVIANNIHDSFILEGPNDPEQYKYVGKMMAREMQRAWFECSKSLKITNLPMPVDVIVGTNWGEIENDDAPNIWEYSLDPYTTLKEV